MRDKLPTIIAIYAASWLFSWGALMADIQATGSKAFVDKVYRTDLGMTCAIALVPGANLVIGILGTGFLEHGWRLSRRPE